MGPFDDAALVVGPRLINPEHRSASYRSRVHVTLGSPQLGDGICNVARR
jgi:hypothetical protein